MYNFDKPSKVIYSYFITLFLMILSNGVFAITQDQKLVASDGAMDDLFGGAVKISGNYAVVGANQAKIDGELTGAAYVFEYDGNDWIEKVKLIPPQASENFAASVGISGDRIIVGAPNAIFGTQQFTGAAYIYERDVAGSWNLVQRIMASDNAFNDRFGTSVSIDGDQLVVSAPQNDDIVNGSGSVYVFEFVNNTWLESQILLASDSLLNDHLGTSLDLQGNRLIMGAPGADDAVLGANTGKVYVFEKSGAIWSETQIFTAGTDMAVGDRFGYSISLSGDRVLVGAPDNSDDGTRSGSAYVFEYNPSTFIWDSGEKFTASDAQAYDNFGFAVSIDGNKMLIGATGTDEIQSNSGSVYSYFHDSSSWTYLNQIFHTDTPSLLTDTFGNSIDMEGGQSIIGSNGDDRDQVTGYDSGAAYIFDLDIAPTAVDDTATAIEDIGVIYLRVLDNDTDVDGGFKFIESYTQSNNGNVGTFGPSISYRPNSNYCNDGVTTDDFTYTLNGGSTATVKITITCIDDAPVAVNDSFSVNEDDQGLIISVLNNDNDIDGGTITIINTTQPNNGTVVNNSNNVIYTPNANYCNDGVTTDDFTYTLNEGSSATVFMTVICTDDAPVAFADSATIDEDSNAIDIQVLSNDTDVDGGDKNIISVTQPTGGTVTHNTVFLSYLPDSDYCNTDSATDDFTYTLNGGSSATVSVRVNCIDDAPVAVNDLFSVNEDAQDFIISVLNNDTDIDGGTKTILSITQPNNGTVVNNSNNVIYTPNANYCNDGVTTDDFTYTLNEGSSANVAVSVTCINDKPSFQIFGDINADQSLLTEMAEYTLVDFANNFVFGPSNESSQAVQQFNVNVASDSSGIINTITLFNDGTLQIEFTRIQGVAIIEVELQDNGGTAEGGVDTSDAMTFNVTYTDTIFSNGFEDTVVTKAAPQYKQSLHYSLKLNYDNEAKLLIYQNYIFEINQETIDSPLLTTIKQWKQEINYMLD